MESGKGKTRQFNYIIIIQCISRWTRLDDEDVPCYWVVDARSQFLWDSYSNEQQSS